jgi:hypothetical protein
MRQTEFQLAAETLTLRASPHVAFTERGIQFAPTISDKDLLSIGHRLFAVKSYLTWAIGSLFNEMLRRRTDPKGNTDAEWLLSFCESLRIDPKLRREALEVFQFYQAAPATAPRLNFEYYREAYWGTCDGKPEQLSRALRYLEAAERDTLSVTELRRLIRSSHAVEQPDETQSEFEGYGVIFDFRRMASRELSSLASYTSERAALILSDLGDAIAYIDGLRSIAAHAVAV